MPVVESFPPGSDGADNWLWKMKTIIECHTPGAHQNWRDWIKENWGEDLNKFITDFYFEDCFDKYSLTIKNIVSSPNGGNIYSLKKGNLDILQANEHKLSKEFLINHVKVIIQRSYRIENEFHGDWKKKEKDEVKEIFKEIFAQAGFNGKQINKMVSLF